MVEEEYGSDEVVRGEEVCLRHFMNERVNLHEVCGKGYGNCLECVIDYKNKLCKGYISFYLPAHKCSNQPTCQNPQKDACR